MAAARSRRQAPVIVIGTGAAGLACALALAPHPVLLLTKTTIPEGGSSLLSQGGIAAALDRHDSPARHAEDTVRAGAGLVEHERAQILARDGARVMLETIAAGFPADRNEHGELKLGREGAHSVARIVHAGGDATGRNLVAWLMARIRATPSIEVLTSTIAVELLVQAGSCVGVLAYRNGAGWCTFEAPAVVLATGGSGALWRETTNPAEATGDGLALAARAGARLADLEFMQFHPTALLPAEADGGVRLPLLTEALRGAGAILIDETGRPFMADLHPLADLAPRDVVARAIAERRQAGATVFLDLRPALLRHGVDAFPQCLQLCREAGLEPLEEPVPVAPAAHYHMGGVVADADGRTTLPGLWACGEVASTGVHGANRLASNSLLEALVWGQRLARAVIRSTPDIPGKPGPTLTPPRTGSLHHANNAIERLRTIMSRDVGITRVGANLDRAAHELQQLERELVAQQALQSADEYGTVRRWFEARNALLAARLIVHAATRRKESRGAHFQHDAPVAEAGPARHQQLTLADLKTPWAASNDMARNA